MNQAILEGLPVASDCPIVVDCNGFINTPPNSKSTNVGTQTARKRHMASALSVESSKDRHVHKVDRSVDLRSADSVQTGRRRSEVSLGSSPRTEEFQVLL